MAFSDPKTSWSNLLRNDIWEVYRAESERNAREIAASLLWEPTFPGKPVPELESMSRRVIFLIVILLIVVLVLPVLFAFLGWWGPIFRLLGG
jgi:hypothetical protein